MHHSLAQGVEHFALIPILSNFQETMNANSIKIVD